MTSFELFLAGGLVVVILLLVALLLRRSGPMAGMQAELAELTARQQERDTALARLDGQLQMIGAAQESRLQSLTQTTLQTLEALRETVDQKLLQAQADARAGRAELAQGFAAFEQRADQRATARDAASTTRGETLERHLATMTTALREQLAGLAQTSQQNAELLRTAMNERLAAIQADNAAKLEEMRKTVDEKLHATLEQRLGQSFQLVSERLEQVHRGLGEMQNLAAGVGDLKRVLTNVKTRGTWGEVQLDALIGQLLTPDQYAKNVATRPGSSERVEFALRLPGNGHEPVWLPIDAKFPVEDYQRLLDAHDRADVDGIEAAAKALETRLKAEAKTIREKYVEPPATTDFAILYLPTEGLYAEALRRPGLAETLQREQRVVVAGPTNLAALLNSLQMGFRTLAIEKRASEVWQVLGQVKTEFGKFGEVIEATKKRLDQARNQFDQVGTRQRAIERRLRDVEALPLPEPEGLLPLPGEDA